MSTETIERPLLEHQRVPVQVESRRRSGVRPRENLYRANEPLLRGFADKTFWTEEYVEAAIARGLTGFGGGSGTATVWLDFAGFKVVESKRNRNGWSYRWARDERQPWPNREEDFAPKITGAAKLRMEGKLTTPTKAEAPAKNDADVVEQDLAATEAVIQPVPKEAVPQGNAEEDTALALATEYEQTALRLQRQIDTQTRAFKEDIEAANARAQRLLRRQAELEGMVHERDRMIAKVTSQYEEAMALAKETVPRTVEAAGVLTEQTNTLNRVKAERDALIDQVERLDQDLKDARIAARNATPASADDTEWWPLDSKEVGELINDAARFNLEVRVQARQKS